MPVKLGSSRAGRNRPIRPNYSPTRRNRYGLLIIANGCKIPPLQNDVLLDSLRHVLRWKRLMRWLGSSWRGRWTHNLRLRRRGSDSSTSSGTNTLVTRFWYCISLQSVTQKISKRCLSLRMNDLNLRVISIDQFNSHRLRETTQGNEGHHKTKTMTQPFKLMS